MISAIRVTGIAWLIMGSFCASVRSRAAKAVDLPDSLGGDYPTQVQPLIRQYCIGCHSTEKHKGSLDLERFGTLAQVHKDVKPWQLVVEHLEAEEMPPEEKPQPTPQQRMQLVAWVRNFLDAEAKARAGDPGRCQCGG